MPAILTEATAEYLADLRPPADDLIAEMEAHAEAEGIPIAAREVAGLQAILARAVDADRALEFGTAIGYSTLHVARTGTEVVTLEVDAGRIAAAEEYLERDGVPVRVTGGVTGGVTGQADARGSARVHIVRGPALETAPDLEGPFDVVFIDAVKEEYREYLELALPMVPEGGVVVADNLLWAGNVPADDEDVQEERRDSTEALRAFNEHFVGHDRLDAVVTPLADGTGVAAKVG